MNLTIKQITNSELNNIINLPEYKEGINLSSLKFHDFIKKNKLVIFINMTDSHKILKKYIKKLIKYI